MENKLPKGWEKIKLGDVVYRVNDIVKDRSKWDFERYIAGDHFDEGEIRITRSAPIEGNEKVIGYQFQWRFKPGQVLYVVKNPRLRKGGMVDFEGVCSISSFVLETHKERLLQELLPFIIQTEGFTKHALNHSHGSTNPFLNWKDIASYDLFLPSFDEQKKISELLWGIENHIKATEDLLKIREIAYEKAIKKILFSNKAKSEIVSDFLQLQYGVGLTEKDRVSGSVPVIGSTGITGYHHKELIKGPAVIIGRKGNAGNVIYIEEDCFPIDTTYYLKINSDKILLKYAYYLLKHANLTQHVEVTAVPGLNRNYVHDMQLPLPDKREQIKAVEIFEKMKKNIELTKYSLTSLKSLRQKLTNELLIGKLRL